MKWILIIISLAIVCGCKTRHDSSAINSITCNLHGDYASVSDSVSHIDYVILQDTSDNMIGKIDKVIMDDERIYVGDYKSRRISVYQTNGRYVGCIKKHGRGPGEYAEIRDFTLDGKYIYVLDNFTDKVIVYNKHDMSFNNVLKLPFNAWDFEVLDNGGFVFAYAPQLGHFNIDSNLRYKLIITDSELNIRQRYFNYKNKDADALAFKNYLTSYGDYIVYSTFAESGYYILSKNDGSVIKNVNIDLSYQLPLSERSNIKAIEENKYSYQYDVPIMCNNYMAFKFSTGGIAYDYFLNTCSNAFLLNSPKASCNIFGIVGSYKDLYIAYWGNSQIYDIVVDNGFPKAEENVERQIMADSSYLVLYHMK